MTEPSARDVDHDTGLGHVTYMAAFRGRLSIRSQTQMHEKSLRVVRRVGPRSKVQSRRCGRDGSLPRRAVATRASPKRGRPYLFRKPFRPSPAGMMGYGDTA